MYHYNPTPTNFYNNYIYHSGVEGMTWKNHKYIRKANGSYYYPEGSGGSGAKFGEYSKGDHDFDEKNYNENNRLGDTDFFGFTKPDGTFVILEEDMKWTLPKGTKVTPELIKRLESFGNDIEARRQRGEKISPDDWTDAATKAINGNNSGNEGLSEKDIDELSNQVIRGEFDNGGKRKELLGEYYQKVQDRVNQKLKGKIQNSNSKKGSKKR